MIYVWISSENYKVLYSGWKMSYFETLLRVAYCMSMQGKILQVDKETKGVKVGNIQEREVIRAGLYFFTIKMLYDFWDWPLL